jgi:hypothetical protein
VIVELLAASRRLEFDFAAQLQLQQQAPGDDPAAAAAAGGGGAGGSADRTVFPWMELVRLQQKRRRPNLVNLFFAMMV